ncbi:hypothetical protein P9112_000077 [Eukaryota sp. TZLM1-RC]
MTPDNDTISNMTDPSTHSFDCDDSTHPPTTAHNLALSERPMETIDNAPDSPVCIVPEETTALNTTMNADTNASPLKIYTDGSFLKTKGKCGFAVYYVYNSETYSFYGPLHQNTHNYGEFEAVRVALCSLLLLENCPQEIVIYSDSNLLVRALNKKAVIRQKKLKYLLSTIKSLMSGWKLNKFTFNFENIAAHVGHHGNQMADKLAKLGAEGNTSENMKLLTPSKLSQQRPPEPIATMKPMTFPPVENVTDNCCKNVCPFCDDNFERSRDLCSHLKDNHPSLTQDELLLHQFCKCPCCQQIFTTRGFDIHWNSQHQGPQEQLVPEISSNTMVELTRRFGSLNYTRLKSKVSWRYAIDYISNNVTISQEQKCRYLLLLPLVCLKINNGSCIVNLIQFMSNIQSINTGSDSSQVIDSMLSHVAPKHTLKNPGGINKKRVQELIRDNELSRAMNMVTRTNAQLSLSQSEVKKELDRLHPKDDNLQNYESPPEVLTNSMTLSVQEVEDAILEMPASEGGVFHWHGKLLKECLNNNIIRCIHFLANSFYNGTVSECLKFAVTSSRLIALPKTSNKLRPIAIGELFYRVIARIILNKCNTEYLSSSNQFGVKVSGGAECIIHAIRQNLGSKFERCIKFDIANAFNELNRGKLLSALEKYCPRLVPFYKTSYLSPSSLFYGEDEVISEKGVKQGDPLGPLLFATSLVEPINILQTLFPDSIFLAYLDDIFVLTNVQSSQQIIEEMTDSLQLLDLTVNTNKTSTLSNEDTFTVLGSFVGPGAEEMLYNSSPNEFRNCINNISELTIQNQLLLIRTCLNTRLSFTARTHKPTTSTKALAACHDLLVEFITNTLGQLPKYKELVSFPVASFGGLGLKNYCEIADLCYHASVASANITMNSMKLDKLLDQYDVLLSTTFVKTEISEFNNGKRLQSLLTNQFYKKAQKEFLVQLRTPDTHSEISSTTKVNDYTLNCKPLAGTILTSLPVTADFTLPDHLMRYILKCRLLMHRHQTHHCALCGHCADSLYHSANCEQFSRMRIDKHDSILKTIAEKTGLQTEQKLFTGRIDLLNTNETHGYDLTMVGGYHSCIEEAIGRSKNEKIEKYSGWVDNVTPLVFYPSGGLDASFIQFLRKYELKNLGKWVAMEIIRKGYMMNCVYHRMLTQIV